MENYKEGYISQSAAIALIECLNYFNFDKCSSLMSFLEWHWDRCNGIPDIDDIKYVAKQLLLDAYNGYYKNNSKESYTVSSGGFEARYEYDVDEGHIFTLKFVAVES